MKEEIKALKDKAKRLLEEGNKVEADKLYREAKKLARSKG